MLGHIKKKVKFARKIKLKKILFEANFKNNFVGKNMHVCLFRAMEKIAPDYNFLGICKYDSSSRFGLNTNVKRIDFCGCDNLWNNTILPFIAFTNKNVPFYFPNAHVANFIPATTPIITMIKEVLPLNEEGYFSSTKDEKAYRRQLQTDINRSDLIFVPTKYTKKRLIDEFYIDADPVVINFASLIDSQYLDLPLSRNTERYFFVEIDDTSVDSLNALLKIYIYMYTKGKNDLKLYISGNIKNINEELLINFDVARKLGAIREYKNLSLGQRASFLRGAIGAIFLSSNMNNLPIKHLDAMRCSCPVVSEFSLAVKEICEEAVIYANVFDMSAFAEILLRLEQDNDFRKEYIYKGLYKEKDFSWENSASIFIENAELISETN